MKFNYLCPILRTKDLDATISFYTDVLGFTLSERNDEWGRASAYRDKIEIMLATPNEHMPFDKAEFTGSFYFNTDDVDSLWEQLKDKANIVYGIEDFEWEMREFAIYDNNGYMLQFGEALRSV